MYNNDRITDDQAASRMPEWQLKGGAAHLSVKCSGFQGAMQFVNGVADLAEAANHHPDIDIRFNTVNLALSSHDVKGMSERDVALGEKIVALAESLGATASS